MRRVVGVMRLADTRMEYTVAAHAEDDARARVHARQRAGKQTDHGADRDQHAEKAHTDVVGEVIERRRAGAESGTHSFEPKYGNVGGNHEKYPADESAEQHGAWDVDQRVARLLT